MHLLSLLILVLLVHEYDGRATVKTEAKGSVMMCDGSCVLSVLCSQDKNLLAMWNRIIQEQLYDEMCCGRAGIVGSVS